MHVILERQLQAEGKTRHDLGRDAFLERAWRWKEESGGTIIRLGTKTNSGGTGFVKVPSVRRYHNGGGCPALTSVSVWLTGSSTAASSVTKRSIGLVNGKS